VELEAGITEPSATSIFVEPRPVTGGSGSPKNKEPWIFLWSGLGTAAWNMAVDEWLLATAQGRPPVLRLYGWQRPTLSLGRHESWQEVANLSRLEAAGVSLVRRPTGGRAVLHDREITYSVSAGLDGEALWRDRLQVSLARISSALVRGLRRLGVLATFAPTSGAGQKSPGHSLCFQSTTRFELTVEGVKAVGSAQYRTERGFLQHGSIPTRPTLSALWRLGPRTGPCPVDPELPLGLNHCARTPIEDLAKALAEGVEEEFGIRGGWVGQDWVNEAAVSELVRARYESSEWTFRR
jgi:lipoate-protein ligase A